MTANVVFCLLYRKKAGTMEVEGASKCEVLDVKDEDRHPLHYVPADKWGILAYVIHHGLPVSIVFPSSRLEVVIKSHLHFALFWSENFTSAYQPGILLIRRMERCSGRERKKLDVRFVKKNKNTGRTSYLKICTSSLDRRAIDFFFDRYCATVLSMKSFEDYSLTINGYEIKVGLEIGMTALPNFFNELSLDD